MAILKKHTAQSTTTRSPPSHATKLAKKLRSPKRLLTRKIAQQRTQHEQQHKQPAHSAPASPQRGQSPAPMEIVQPEAKQTESVQPQQPEPVKQEQSAYTPAEQKMVDTIQSVSTKIDELARGLPTLQGQIDHHRTRLALFKWHPKNFSFDPEKLNRSQKQLHYAAGMVDESVLQQIFRLDAVQTENDAIRKLRKATVQKGNETIKAAVALRERMNKLQRFVPAWTPEVEKAVPMEDVAPAAPTESKKPEQQPQHESDSSDDEDSHMEDVQQPAAPAPKSPPQQKSSPAPAPKSPPQPPVASTPTPALTPLQKKYAHLDLPTYAGPAFHARVHPQSGSLLIEGDMEGIRTDDISVVPDHKARTLTIRGVRLPERRRSVPQSFGFFGLPQQRLTPFGHFEKTIDLDELDPHGVLDLAGLKAVIDPRQQQLQISLPRAKPAARPVTQQTARAARPIQQPVRRPVQHTTGFSYSSDEDEADSFSHPYSSYSSPYSAYRQPSYARRPPAPQPFFGGFW